MEGFQAGLAWYLIKYQDDVIKLEPANGHPAYSDN